MTLRTMAPLRSLALGLMLTAVANAQDMPLTQVLIEGEGWQEVASGFRFTDACANDADGNFYFSDVLGGTTIEKIAPDGRRSTVVTDVPRVSGMQFGPDGRLYACQGGTLGRVIAIDVSSGKIEVLLKGLKPNDLVVSPKGDVYVTETGLKQVRRIAATGEVSVAAKSSADFGPQRPNGIALTPDFGTLAVSDHGGRYTWVWRIDPDGGLAVAQPYITLRTPGPDAPSKGDGMETDAEGRFYVTSAAGLQMFDPTGRMGGVIAAPSGQPIVSVAFAGAQLEYLYVAAGDKIFRRKTKTRGTAVSKH